VLTIITFLITGGGGEVKSMADIDAPVNAAGLLMLISLAVVVITALLNRHIIEALIYGNATAFIIGLLTGKLKLGSVFSIPAERGESTGLIEEGISGVTGAIMFVLIVLGITQILIESGAMNKLLRTIQNTIAKSVRQAESAIVYITLLVSIPIAANAPAIMLIGPSIVKPLGEKFNLSAERRANLMDCAVNTIFFILPWHVAVIVWYSTIVSTAEEWGITYPHIMVAAFNPYTWGLLLVLFLSILTGWNRSNTGKRKKV